MLGLFDSDVNTNRTVRVDVHDMYVASARVDPCICRHRVLHSQFTYKIRAVMNAWLWR